MYFDVERYICHDCRLVLAGGLSDHELGYPHSESISNSVLEGLVHVFDYSINSAARPVFGDCDACNASGASTYRMYFEYLDC